MRLLFRVTLSNCVGSLRWNAIWGIVLNEVYCKWLRFFCLIVILQVYPSNCRVVISKIAEYLQSSIAKFLSNFCILQTKSIVFANWGFSFATFSAIWRVCLYLVGTIWYFHDCLNMSCNRILSVYKCLAENNK